MSLLTIDRIRKVILDRGLEDNLARFRLTFDDTDVTSAMESCAANYNAIPPYVHEVTVAALPDRAEFIEGTIAALFRAGLNRLRRNLVSFNTGQTEIPFSQGQIEQFEKLSKEHEERFQLMASDRKKWMNLNQAYGSVF